MITYGQLIHIHSPVHNKYVSVDRSGDLSCDRSLAGDYESFTIEGKSHSTPIRFGDSIHIRSFVGKFVTVSISGVPIANRDSPTEMETLVISDAEEPNSTSEVTFEKQFLLTARGGKVLAVEPNGTVLANTTKFEYNWDKLKFVKVLDTQLLKIAEQRQWTAAPKSPRVNQDDLDRKRKEEEERLKRLAEEDEERKRREEQERKRREEEHKAKELLMRQQLEYEREQKMEEERRRMEEERRRAQMQMELEKRRMAEALERSMEEERRRKQEEEERRRLQEQQNQQQQQDRDEERRQRQLLRDQREREQIEREIREEKEAAQRQKNARDDERRRIEEERLRLERMKIDERERLARQQQEYIPEPQPQPIQKSPRGRERSNSSPPKTCLAIHFHEEHGSDRKRHVVIANYEDDKPIAEAIFHYDDANSKIIVTQSSDNKVMCVIKKKILALHPSFRIKRNDILIAHSSQRFKVGSRKFNYTVEPSQIKYELIGEFGHHFLIKKDDVLLVTIWDNKQLYKVDINSTNSTEILHIIAMCMIMMEQRVATGNFSAWKL